MEITVTLPLVLEDTMRRIEAKLDALAVYSGDKTLLKEFNEIGPSVDTSSDVYNAIWQAGRES